MKNVGLATTKATDSEPRLAVNVFYGSDHQQGRSS